MDPLKTLLELSNQYQPTKRYHNYIPLFERFLDSRRDQVRLMFEIGVQTDRSVKMWADYFYNAQIVGLDIDKNCKQYEQERIQIRIGNQFSADFLQQVGEEFPSPDVIIDDGSHRPTHQIFSFNKLFPILSEYGLYFIEDMGGMVGNPANTTVRYFCDLARRCINYWPDGLRRLQWVNLTSFNLPPKSLERTITGISFFRTFIVIEKGHNPEDNPWLGRIERDANGIVQEKA